uniref:Uncharacterized protein n=1 Tax=Arundo donax TaxID=35708 RepID=A0A0A9FYX1_ARUDO
MPEEEDDSLIFVLGSLPVAWSWTSA